MSRAAAQLEISTVRIAAIVSGYLTSEHHHLQEAARSFTDREIVPIASELDRKDVNLPASIIEKTMRKRMILVSDLMEDGRKAGLRLAIGDYSFASIRISSSSPAISWAVSSAIVTPPWTAVGAISRSSPHRQT